MDEAAEAKQEKLKRIKENYPSYYVFVLTLSSEKKGLFFPPPPQLTYEKN